MAGHALFWNTPVRVRHVGPVGHESVSHFLLHNPVQETRLREEQHSTYLEPIRTTYIQVSAGYAGTPPSQHSAVPLDSTGMTWLPRLVTLDRPNSLPGQSKLARPVEMDFFRPRIDGLCGQDRSTLTSNCRRPHQCYLAVRRCHCSCPLSQPALSSNRQPRTREAADSVAAASVPSSTWVREGPTGWHRKEDWILEGWGQGMEGTKLRGDLPVIVMESNRKPEPSPA